MSGLPSSWTEQSSGKTLTEEETAFRRGFDHALGAVGTFVRYLTENDMRGPDGELDLLEVLSAFEEVSREFRMSRDAKRCYSQQVQNEVAERLGLRGAEPGPDASEKHRGAIEDETDEK